MESLREAEITGCEEAKRVKRNVMLTEQRETDAHIHTTAKARERVGKDRKKGKKETRGETRRDTHKESQRGQGRDEEEERDRREKVCVNTSTWCYFFPLRLARVVTAMVTNMSPTSSTHFVNA